MKTFVIILLLVHGAIHLLGFVKAFQLASLPQLTQPISKRKGFLWLFNTVLFLTSAGFLILNLQTWWMFAAASLILSQVLIIQSWSDARFGTLVNIILLLPVLIAYANSLPSSFRNQYKAEVQKRLNPIAQSSVVTKEDIQHLPPLVQKYLEYAGVLGRPKVHNFRVVFHGSMKRSKESDWMDIISRQYNFFDDPARLFYIKSSLYGIPFDGLHMYVGDSARMQIKIASMVPIADARGGKMNRSETVTMFNDMCFMAPATLIDKTIQWETVDSLNVKATFTNKGNCITAFLTFNENGQLVDFISHDRYLSADGKTYESYPWSTPIKNYRDFSGRMIPTYAEAIWHMPGGEYSYAKFKLIEIEYNCPVFR